MITIDENLFLVLIGFLLALAGVGWTLFDYIRTRDEEGSLLSLFSILATVVGVLAFLFGLIAGFSQGLAQ